MDTAAVRWAEATEAEGRGIVLEMAADGRETLEAAFASCRPTEIRMVESGCKEVFTGDGRPTQAYE